MVALKPRGRSRAIRESIRKQERRGGIETGIRDGRLEEAGVKQERRGGIETRCIESRNANCGCEAGTPWWH